MTHNGPDNSSTAIDTIETDVPIYCGSDHLFNILKENKYNILFNVHGHTHAGAGRANIKKVQVINPGSLSWGEFGIIKLSRNALDNKWII
mmetsp:Transcript_24106/g.21175  ORF Transcript_24106/g.21175 Transcript_24106/m.21175 type:complete len:90 (+) Transcript_24106:674-943(+)